MSHNWFQYNIAVKVTDLNYGHHLANAKMADFLHEARFRFLQSLGYVDEGHIDGVGLILKRLNINFVREVGANDLLTIQLSCNSISQVKFNIHYSVCNQQQQIVATADTLMIAFCYERHKIGRLSASFLTKLLSFPQECHD